jgi:hypothetical protein
MGVYGWRYSDRLPESPDKRADALIANLKRGLRHRPSFYQQFERTQHLHLPTPLSWTKTGYLLEVSEQRALRQANLAR